MKSILSTLMLGAGLVRKSLDRAAMMMIEVMRLTREMQNHPSGCCDVSMLALVPKVLTQSGAKEQSQAE